LPFSPVELDISLPTGTHIHKAAKGNSIDPVIAKTHGDLIKERNLGIYRLEPDIMERLLVFFALSLEHSGWIISQVKVAIQVQVELEFGNIPGKTEKFLLFSGCGECAANNLAVSEIRFLLKSYFTSLKRDKQPKIKSLLKIRQMKNMPGS
jgi:hypothetical protein